MINTKRCAICQRPRDTLYWHKDPDNGSLWVYCKGKCQRGYSLYAYCAAAGVSVSDFLKNKIDFKEATPNEVTQQEWPKHFIPLSDPRAQEGVDYIRKQRGLEPAEGMYYDMERKGIVFPYFFGSVFVGAQTRFLEPFVDANGNDRKIDTMSGTRLGLLFYNWNQDVLMSNIKGVIAVEGAFDAQAIQQALNATYGSAITTPWRAIACSGSGATKHQLEQMNELVNKGYKVIVAPDSDEAGLDMLKKFKNAKACTHYAFTGKTGVDWNDVFMEENDPKEYLKWFFSKVNNV